MSRRSLAALGELLFYVAIRQQQARDAQSQHEPSQHEPSQHEPSRQAALQQARGDEINEKSKLRLFHEQDLKAEVAEAKAHIAAAPPAAGLPPGCGVGCICGIIGAVLGCIGVIGCGMGYLRQKKQQEVPITSSAGPPDARGQVESPTKENMLMVPTITMPKMRIPKMSML